MTVHLQTSPPNVALMKHKQNTNIQERASINPRSHLGQMF